MGTGLKIYIDGRAADIDDNNEAAVTYTIGKIEEIGISRTSFSKALKLPATSRNNILFGNIGQVHSGDDFLRETHYAKIEYDGSVLLEGTLSLVECCSGDNSTAVPGYYKVTIVSSSMEWADHASRTSLKDLNIDFEETLSRNFIADSWTSGGPVAFFPVKRENFVTYEDNKLYTALGILTFEDYHPFLHVKSLIRQIFSEAGYTFRSGFMESEFFNRLYISGNYRKKDTEALKKKMDFRAGRYRDTGAVADSLGMVYAAPYVTYNSIGNLVESADPDELSEGKKIDGVFDNGNCVMKDGDRIMFKPPSEVTASFEYSLVYTTDYRMKNRHQLKGFDTLYLGDGQKREYIIPNTFQDNKERFITNYVYNVIIFDHGEGNIYQLRYDEITDNNGTPVRITRTYATFSEKTLASVNVISINQVENPQLWLYNSESGAYEPYQKDWALYDGDITETGRVKIKVRIRSYAEKILPSQPKYFDSFTFGGADPGMELTLHNDTAVRPLFGQYPAEGSKVVFSDIAVHDESCLQFVNSLKQMFNLWFLTDPISKTVYIESRNNFYSDDTIVDLSGRIDREKPVVLSETARGLKETVSLLYKTGDGAVSTWNRRNEGTFGKYEYQQIGYRKGETSVENPMFTASVNSTGVYEGAPAASFLCTGNPNGDAEDLNFPAKIVLYSGITTLPSGEIWGWPFYGRNYPYIFFHSGDDEGMEPDSALEGTGTLCFEDRDGKRGLHRFWDGTMEIFRSCRRITAYICLSGAHIENIIRPNNIGKDFRALYKLKVDNETVLCRLESIEDYDPNHRSTKCVFIQI